MYLMQVITAARGGGSLEKGNSSQVYQSVNPNNACWANSRCLDKKTCYEVPESISSRVPCSPTRSSMLPPSHANGVSSTSMMLGKMTDSL